jgi:hypothetical protein
MNSVIQEIKERLKKYPAVCYEETPSSLTVLPADDSGFAVCIMGDESRWTVSFDDWHEEFDDGETALNCFAFGLSEHCRLEVRSRGSFDHAWTLQERDDEGNWFSCDRYGCATTGLLVFPFWLPRKIRHLQNHVIAFEAQK